MTSIGQVTAAVAAARQDTTLALANLNLEVNLFTKRVSPPVEYQGVGQHLAQWRLKEAQDGTQHTTARKLGILFREVLPTTPALIKAYGTRASEIGSSARANPKGNSFSYGPFGDRIGADATALWAAATSGHAAIQCHLLACMLARMWDAPEATSLWEEIVTRRKREIEAQFEAEGDIRTDSMLAVVEQFPRADLAKWDASCRSWLRVADSEKATQQTKLRLIVDNLDLPVNNKPDTYDSVLTAWTTAMEGVERLLGGTPLGLQTGGLLLGLMSWHLYPDLECLAATNPRVELRDCLFAGKEMLTIGLEPAPHREVRSVYWSLPLARLRYYGLPVTKMSSTRSSERDRITVDELLFAWFSAYIKGWDSDPSIPSTAIVQFAGQVAERLGNALTAELAKTNTNLSQSQSWLRLLARIAKEWGTALDQPRAKALRNMGRNFCRPAEAPFQGIFSVDTYLKVAINTEDKVRLLREIASSLASEESPGDVVINQWSQSRAKERRKNSENLVVMKLSHGSEYGFDVVVGDGYRMALLRRRQSTDRRPILHQNGKEAAVRTAKPGYKLSTKKIMQLFLPGCVDFASLTRCLELNFRANASLLGMTYIDELYRQLGNATVDVRAAKVDLHAAHWVSSAFRELNDYGEEGDDVGPAVWGKKRRSAALATRFACIAMMETGTFNFQPSDLSSVFALCSADSLYIASAVLSDPAQVDSQQAGIIRVTGNIGRAGMALMVPPKSPVMRDYEVDDWYLYQHHVFYGVLDDSFGGTSLQLSFTGWEQPLNIGTFGGIDVEAYYLETVISVYDRDKWIADLDILETYRSDRLLQTFLAHQSCACSSSPAVTEAHARAKPTDGEAKMPLRLISVGNFAEIIAAPSEPGIVTASGNWQARLAAASICIAKGYRVILKPLDYCWPCLARTEINGESVSSIIEESSTLAMIL
ncbi:hypothetical protein VTI28DRAFT_2563 [Corynascus sepedonium]